MNYALTSTSLPASLNPTPDPAHLKKGHLKKGKEDRKRALIVLSCALTIAVGAIALVIGTSASEAANLPIFTAANALSAKQDAGVAGIATASLAIIAFGALALFSSKKL